MSMPTLIVIFLKGRKNSLRDLSSVTGRMANRTVEAIRPGIFGMMAAGTNMSEINTVKFRY